MSKMKINRKENRKKAKPIYINMFNNQTKLGKNNTKMLNVNPKKFFS